MGSCRVRHRSTGRSLTLPRTANALSRLTMLSLVPARGALKPSAIEVGWPPHRASGAHAGLRLRHPALVQAPRGSQPASRRHAHGVTASSRVVNFANVARL
jgi:hypothetical protein